MRTRLLVFITLLSILILLAGCNPNTYLSNMMERMAPDDDEAFAKQYFSALRARDFDTAKRILDPQFVKPGLEANLTKVAKFLDQGDPLSVELIGCNVFFTPEKRRSSLTYQYHFTNSWLLAAITIDTAGNNKRVFAVNVYPLPKSLGELNAFTIKGKGIQHYIMLLLAIAIPIFILVVLIDCIRTKMWKRKWLWVIFILFGFGKLSLNWTTGQFFFNLLSIQIQLFGAGCIKQGIYAPWFISISVPLGAIIFLIRRNKLAEVKPPLMEQKV